MKRRRLSTSTRLELFQAHGGVCHLCGAKIQVGEAWDVSHDRPLALLGADDESNWFPSHRKCHRAHTASVDTPNISRAKRREARHLGAVKSKSPLPCGRDSRWKRKINGEVVLR